jgi:hypothetical protein
MSLFWHEDLDPINAFQENDYRKCWNVIVHCTDLNFNIAHYIYIYIFYSLYLFAVKLTFIIRYISKMFSQHSLVKLIGEYYELVYNIKYLIIS